MATWLHIAAWSSAALLLLLPGLLFGLKLIRPRWLPLWVVFTLIIFGGWILANLAVHLRLAHLDHLVKAMDEIDENDPIVQAWVADGAPKVFALVFGWAYGLVVTVAWLPVIGLGYAIAWRRRVKRARTSGIHAGTDAIPWHIWIMDQLAWLILAQPVHLGEKRRRLVASIQWLALPADQQRTALPDPTLRISQILPLIHEAIRHAPELTKARALSTKQSALAEQLSTLLNTIQSADNPLGSNSEALDTHPLWSQLHETARQAAEEFGVECDRVRLDWIRVLE